MKAQDTVNKEQGNECEQESITVNRLLLFTADYIYRRDIFLSLKFTDVLGDWKLFYFTVTLLPFILRGIE